MQIGKVDLSKSPIGLGLAAIGRPGYINLGHDQDLPDKSPEAMEAQAHELLQYAWDHGVRYFDMARSYGMAEKFMSGWLKKVKPPKDEIVVASKWGYIYTADWKVRAENHEIKYHTLENFEKQVSESLKYLEDYLKIYQIHSATIQSGVLTNMKVLEAMGKLKDQGTRLGLSLSGPQQAETLQLAMNVKINGTRLFDVVQATYNMLEQSVGSTLQKARDEGMLVVVKEALANGQLADHQHIQFTPDIQTKIESMISKRGTMDQVSLNYVLNKPFVDIVLSGAAHTRHLMSNLKTPDLKLNNEDYKTLDKVAVSAQKYWERRSVLEWN